MWLDLITTHITCSLEAIWGKLSIKNELLKGIGPQKGRNYFDRT